MTIRQDNIRRKTPDKARETGWINADLRGLYYGKFPDSKVHGANMGPNWVLSAPDGPHVGPMNLAIRVGLRYLLSTGSNNTGLAMIIVGPTQFLAHHHASPLANVVLPTK